MRDRVREVLADSAASGREEEGDAMVDRHQIVAVDLCNGRQTKKEWKATSTARIRDTRHRTRCKTVFKLVNEAKRD